MTFAESLKTIRTRHQWSQRYLAEKSGIDQTIISFYESGTRKPGVDNLTALGDALNVSTDELIGTKSEVMRILDKIPSFMIDAFRAELSDDGYIVNAKTAERVIEYVLRSYVNRTQSAVVGAQKRNEGKYEMGN